MWSLISIFALVILLFLWKQFPGNEPSPDDLVVYCAAGIRLPVEEAATAFEKEFGVRITLDYDSSGALEGKLQLDKDSNKTRADLYIPADVSFARRARDKFLTAESIPIASFRLVLASSPQEDLSFSTLDEFLLSRCRSQSATSLREWARRPRKRWTSLENGKRSNRPKKLPPLA